MSERLPTSPRPVPRRRRATDPEVEYHRMRRWVQRAWEAPDPNPFPRFRFWPPRRWRKQHRG